MKPTPAQRRALEVFEQTPNSREISTVHRRHLLRLGWLMYRGAMGYWITPAGREALKK